MYSVFNLIVKAKPFRLFPYVWSIWPVHSRGITPFMGFGELFVRLALKDALKTDQIGLRRTL